MKNLILKPLFIGLLFISSLTSAEANVSDKSSYALNPKARSNWSFLDFRLIPIQNGGRIKPLDSFARESVLFQTGSRSFKNWDPIDLVLSWIVFPQEWENERFIQVSRIDVRRQLNLDENRTRFSPSEVFKNPILIQYSERIGLIGETSKSTKITVKTDPREQELKRLLERSILYNNIITGKIWKIIPNKSGGIWASLSSGTSQETKIHERFANTLKAFKANNNKIFENEAFLLRQAIEGQIVDWNKNKSQKIYLENLYNQTHPFRTAWILYLVAVLAWLAPKRKFFIKAAWIATIFGSLAHIYGFALRCYIAGRPPVTNMYESVVWVMLGVIAFAIILYLKQRQTITLIVACVLSTVGMIVADSAPAMMDPSLNTLVPVLRNNYWLTLHVLTITLGYAALALTFGLGNVTLFHFARKSSGYMAEVSNLNQLTYRAMQFGFVLLFAGTILGGVWADYSWGRFWGWDPKETWALIAILCYLGILHGRLTNWVGQFAFALSTVIGFLSVLMAWYGVNFILGVGLHSYGFSSGGFTGVSIFVLIQIIYICVMTSFYKRGGFKKVSKS